jgi:hypothetical protein
MPIVPCCDHTRVFLCLQAEVDIEEGLKEWEPAKDPNAQVSNRVVLGAQLRPPLRPVCVYRSQRLKLVPIRETPRKSTFTPLVAMQPELLRQRTRTVSSFTSAAGRQGLPCTGRPIQDAVRVAAELRCQRKEAEARI